MNRYFTAIVVLCSAAGFTTGRPDQYGAPQQGGGAVGGGAVGGGYQGAGGFGGGSGFGGGASGGGGDLGPISPAQYSYAYENVDGASGNQYGHGEERDGDNTQGEYRVLLPDGRTQIVKYYVTREGGYVADVTYEGTAIVVGPQGPSGSGGNQQGGGGYSSGSGSGNPSKGSSGGGSPSLNTGYGAPNY